MTFQKGHKPTDQTRRKLSAAARGNAASKGRIWSAESRAKLSAAMKGNKNSKGYSPTAEHRRKLSEANKGRELRPPGWQHAPQTREKIAASLKGTFAKPAERMNLRIAQQVIKLFRPEIHAKKAALSSARLKAQNADPAFRAKVAAGRKAAHERRVVLRQEEAMRKSAVDARRQQIADLRAQGMTLSAIGGVLGLSRERVGQLARMIERATQ